MTGSTSIVPPPDYWATLREQFPGLQIDKLRALSDERLSELTPNALPPPDSTAMALLDRVAADGWLTRTVRLRCPNCDLVLDPEAASRAVCPQCGEAYSQHGGVVTETIYVRDLAPSRAVDWVIVIHGMNTTGAWQESFSWYLGTTWGRSVPVAVYKYGIVIAGVIMAWRRSKLRKELRDKLATLRDEAKARGFTGKPDVVAHSFGTWLLGRLLENELTRDRDERLTFGRVILAGCVLRPDFDWKRMKAEGLVEDVLNHYGTRDVVVPLAHAMINHSGPSGRRGFDGHEVLNVRAEGYGHSDLLTIEKCVVNGESFQKCGGRGAAATTHLQYSYKRTWRPFLTLPQHELAGLLDQSDPPTPWRPLPWPLRGTLFPFLALPLLLALAALVAAGVGDGLWIVWRALAIIVAVLAAGLASLLIAVVVMELPRRLRRPG